MSSIYSTIYHNLCESKKYRIVEYVPGSGLHKHHIVPKHMGGEDEPFNFTYLTVREHIIAHFLLWKIYKEPNDLRAMNMLGANLTVTQRRVVGIWCRDNGIGFHGATPEQRREWALRGIESQKESGSKNSFYWWSTEKGRKERASIGGKASQQSGNAFNLQSLSKEDTIKNAKKGGKLSAKKPATNGTITKKFHTDEDRNAFLSTNPDWRIGQHWTNGMEKC